MNAGAAQAGRQAIERATGDLAAAGGIRAVVLDDGSERGITPTRTACPGCGACPAWS
jgi:hypothetical protein